MEDGIAVITGAASGIGAALARTALRRGLRVVLVDRDAPALEAAAAALSGEVLPIPVDVTDAEAVEALAAQTFDRYGRVDLLFNNCGILAGGNSWEVPLDVWRRVLDVNLMGVVHGIRSFVPRMIAAGRPGRIVNTASVGGLIAGPMIAPYAASKFGVVAISEALAVELRLAGAPVTVSVLAPGPVRTGILAGAQMRPENAADAAIGRMRAFVDDQGLDPDELARRTFEGIDAGLFWVVPQPEHCDAALQARTERICARRNPHPSDYGVAFEEAPA